MNAKQRRKMLRHYTRRFAGTLCTSCFDGRPLFSEETCAVCGGTGRGPDREVSWEMAKQFRRQERDLVRWRRVTRLDSRLFEGFPDTAAALNRYAEVYDE